MAADQTTPDPLAVECPYEGGCGAPAGQPCRTSYAGEVHAERRRLADLRALEHGTCALCGRFMVRGSVEGGEVQAWHPDPNDHGCPPLADPAVDWNSYALALQQGLQPGHPGLEHFVSADALEHVAAIDYNQAPAPDEALCPECQQGKHQNCDGRALHPVTDLMVDCTCTHGGGS